MANLSQYADFTLLLDFTTGKIKLTDTGTYPEGVAAGIKAIINVTQPDEITVEGSWDTPNVVHNGTSLTVGEVELRTQTDSTPQQGAYLVQYIIDHPGYTPTTVEKQFYLSYERTGVEIKENFDVFTPNLSLEDVSNYNSATFNAPQISRLWSVQVGSLGFKTGSGATLDLVHNSNYYDARYTIELITTLTYQHTTYAYLSVKDWVYASKVTTANTPPTFPTLIAYLKEIKERFDGLESDVRTVNARQSYEYAESLLAHIKTRICKGDTMNLYPQIQDFLNVYYDYTSSIYLNTNLPITAYNYGDVGCETGSPSVTDGRITTQLINNWNAAFTSIPPDDMEFEVGVTTGAPVAGTDTFVSSQLVNRRVRLYIGKVQIPSIALTGETRFSKPKDSDTLTIYNYKWALRDYVKIEFY